MDTYCLKILQTILVPELYIISKLFLASKSSSSISSRSSVTVFESSKNDLMTSCVLSSVTTTLCFLTVCLALKYFGPSLPLPHELQTLCFPLTMSLWLQISQRWLASNETIVSNGKRTSLTWPWFSFPFWIELNVLSAGVFSVCAVVVSRLISNCIVMYVCGHLESFPVACLFLREENWNDVDNNFQCTPQVTGFPAVPWKYVPDNSYNSNPQDIKALKLSS